MMDLIRKVQEQDWTAIEDPSKAGFCHGFLFGWDGSRACGPAAARACLSPRLSPYG